MASRINPSNRRKKLPRVMPRERRLEEGAIIVKKNQGCCVKSECGPRWRKSSLPRVQLCVEPVYRLRGGTPDVKVAGVWGRGLSNAGASGRSREWGLRLREESSRSCRRRKGRRWWWGWCGRWGGHRRGVGGGRLAARGRGEEWCTRAGG